MTDKPDTPPPDTMDALIDFARTGKIHLGFQVKMTVDQQDYDDTMQKIIERAFKAGVEYGRANP